MTQPIPYPPRRPRPPRSLWLTVAAALLFAGVAAFAWATPAVSTSSAVGWTLSTTVLTWASVTAIRGYRRRLRKWRHARAAWEQTERLRVHYTAAAALFAGDRPRADS